jgi:hypothetical protein
MPRFESLVLYPTFVELPDSTIVEAAPGSVFDLPFDAPGPLWAPTKAKATDPTPAPAMQPQGTDGPAAEVATETAAPEVPAPLAKTKPTDSSTEAPPTAA